MGSPPPTRFHLVGQLTIVNIINFQQSMYKKAPLKELSTHVSCTSALSCPRCLKKWRQIWEWRGCLRWEFKLGQQVLFFLSFDIIWEFVCMSVCTKWSNMVSSSCLVSVLRARKKLWLILFANVPAYFVISYHRFTFLSFPFSGQGLSSRKFPLQKASLVIKS